MGFPKLTNRLYQKEKVKKEAERFNATLDLNLDTKDSFLLLRNPKKEYDAEYKRYLDKHLVQR